MRIERIKEILKEKYAKDFQSGSQTEKVMTYSGVVPCRVAEPRSGKRKTRKQLLDREILQQLPLPEISLLIDS